MLKLNLAKSKVLDLKAKNEHIIALFLNLSVVSGLFYFILDVCIRNDKKTIFLSYCVHMNRYYIRYRAY